VGTKIELNKLNKKGLQFAALFYLMVSAFNFIKFPFILFITKEDKTSISFPIHATKF
jgi:hypothetical protein